MYQPNEVECDFMSIELEKISGGTARAEAGIVECQNWVQILSKIYIKNNFYEAEWANVIQKQTSNMLTVKSIRDDGFIEIKDYRIVKLVNFNIEEID